MPRTRIIGAPKTLSLTELNTWIAQREQLMGPIVAIGDGGDQTAGTFDLGQPRRTDRFARAAIRVGASCVVAGDTTLVCPGDAYISGVLNPVCVTRAKA